MAMSSCMASARCADSRPCIVLQMNLIWRCAMTSPDYGSPSFVCTLRAPPCWQAAPLTICADYLP